MGRIADGSVHDSAQPPPIVGVLALLSWRGSNRIDELRARTGELPRAGVEQTFSGPVARAPRTCHTDVSRGDRITR